MNDFFYLLAVFPLLVCFNGNNPKNISVNEIVQSRSTATLDSLYKYYSVPNSFLLRETYPLDTSHEATYLATQEHKDRPNDYSYLWPYSGTFSAVNALLTVSCDTKYKELLDTKVLPGLEKYFDTTRKPYAYSSYIKTSLQSDRFYDDNIWIGIDFTDVYLVTKDIKYLRKAETIWKFICSGTDDKLGGGIYWVEQKKESKHACSNAPGAVFALKLFAATTDSIYFYKGKEYYEWTKNHLLDLTDYLVYDNIKLSGKVDKTKYPYNSGQMIQAASLLYKFSEDEIYLQDAQNIAKSSYHFFFEDSSDDEKVYRVLKKSDVWFIAVMMRGFLELYYIDNNRTYLEAFKKNLDFAWLNMRDKKGLFYTDWKGLEKDNKKWLLTQAGMVEMYARISEIKFDK